VIAVEQRELGESRRRGPRTSRCHCDLAVAAQVADEETVATATIGPATPAAKPVVVDIEGKPEASSAVSDIPSPVRSNTSGSFIRLVSSRTAGIEVLDFPSDRRSNMWTRASNRSRDLVAEEKEARRCSAGNQAG